MEKKTNESEEKKSELIPTNLDIFKRYGNISMKTAEQRRLEEEQKSLDGKQEGNSAGNNTGNIDGNKQGNDTSNNTSNMDGKTDGNSASNEDGKAHGNTDGNVTGNVHGNNAGNVHGNNAGNETSNSTGNKKVDLPVKEPRKYKKRSNLLDEIRNEKKTRNKITIYLDRDIDDALKQIAGITRNGMKSEYINRILRDQMIKDGLLEEE